MCCSKNENSGHDQVFLVNSFVMACHRDCSGVCVKVFFKFELAVFDCMLQMIRVFVGQLVDRQAGSVAVNQGPQQHSTSIHPGRVMAGILRCPSAMGKSTHLWQLHHASLLGMDFVW